MTFTEPSTMLTDYLITVASLFFASRLWSAVRSQRLWAVGFALSAVAALTGGTMHGFGPNFSRQIVIGLWDSTLFLIGASAGFMIAGTCTATLGTGRRFLIGGLALTGLGILVLGSGFSLHQHFNQNDLYHLVQLVAFYFFYRGARLLEDTGKP